MKHPADEIFEMNLFYKILDDMKKPAKLNVMNIQQYGFKHLATISAIAHWHLRCFSVSRKNE